MRKGTGFVAAMVAILGAASLPAAVADQPSASSTEELPYTPVITPNGNTLSWEWDGDVKVFHLIAEPVTREFAPGFVVNCWGYNGQTPGPTIEAVEGDRVRILVTNRLPEATTAHWHGLIIPAGMDGMGGLHQRHIEPGETYAYEFTLRQHGTQMYHPHVSEMTQMAMGMEGFFIIHPREPEEIDRDYAIFLHEWDVPPGAATPNPNTMTEFNYFTFNSRVMLEPLVAETGDRVRIRYANLSMDSHPIHLHGHSFKITGTDGGQIPESAQWPETTVNVPVGATRDIEFIANAGDWPLHCHKTHHTMAAMAHEAPVVIGMDTRGLDERIQELLPGYMTMGSGMPAMPTMAMPPNMMAMQVPGPFDFMDMLGMFTVLKVRDELEGNEDPGWYDHPEGTQAWRLDETVEPVIRARGEWGHPSDPPRGREGYYESTWSAPGAEMIETWSTVPASGEMHHGMSMPDGASASPENSGSHAPTRHQH